VDVWLTLLADADRLTQRSRVRLHLGTAEVFARLTPADDVVAPGSRAAVRLRLEEPVVARWGDRGVIRSYSPMRTVGGCVVVDPFPPHRPRRPRALEEKGAPDPLDRALAFVTEAGQRGLEVQDLPVRLGVHPEEAASLTAALGQKHGAQIVDGRIFASDVVANLESMVRTAVATHHRSHPLEVGLPLEVLRARVRESVLIDAAVDRMVAAGDLEVDGASVRQVGFTPSASGEDERLGGMMRDALEQAGAQGLTESELGTVVPPERVRDLAGFEERRGRIARIGRDRYYDAESLTRLRGIIIDLVREKGRATPAELRDATGLTRKYLIPILEWLDSTRATVRDGDVRRLGPTGSLDERNS
jgi:selenocysteine-specific elongation factor